MNEALPVKTGSCGDFCPQKGENSLTHVDCDIKHFSVNIVIRTRFIETILSRGNTDFP